MTELFGAIHSSEKRLWNEVGRMISAKKYFDQHQPGIRKKLEDTNSIIRSETGKWCTANGEPIPLDKVRERAFSYGGGGARMATSWAEMYEHWLKDLRKKNKELDLLFYELYHEIGYSINYIREYYSEELKSIENENSRLGNLMKGYEAVMQEIQRQSYFR